MRSSGQRRAIPEDNDPRAIVRYVIVGLTATVVGGVLVSFGARSTGVAVAPEPAANQRAPQPTATGPTRPQQVLSKRLNDAFETSFRKTSGASARVARLAREELVELLTDDELGKKAEAWKRERPSEAADFANKLVQRGLHQLSDSERDKLFRLRLRLAESDASACTALWLGKQQTVTRSLERQPDSTVRIFYSLHAAAMRAAGASEENPLLPPAPLEDSERRVLDTAVDRIVADTPGEGGQALSAAWMGDSQPNGVTLCLAFKALYQGVLALPDGERAPVTRLLLKAPL